MPARLTISYIKEKFEEEGYTLLTDTYEHCERTRLEYICPNGHQHSILWNNFRRGQRCPYCNNNAKLNISYIKEQLEKEGYTLVSTIYKDNKSKLKALCPEGHIWSFRWNDFSQGKRCRECYLEVLRLKGEDSLAWKGGTDVSLYDTYKDRLAYFQEVFPVEKDGLVVIGAPCKYCGKTCTPSRQEVWSRIKASERINYGEAHFYCSDRCKQACPTYQKHTRPRGFAPATSREVQPELRKLVFERDNYACQICGEMEVELHCHHITGVEQNPIESADLDNCITLCKKHHKKVHKLPNCGYNELRCNK